MHMNRKSCGGYAHRHTCKSQQSCPTLCSPMDCSSPGSSFHGILQASIAISSSRIHTHAHTHTHTHNGMLLSHEEENVATCSSMCGQEGIVLSEIGQKEKDRRCMISLICEIQKIQHTSEYSKKESDSQT